MTNYTVQFSRSQRKMLDRLPSRVREHIESEINALAIEPRPRGTSKIKGEANSFRIRVGDYRIVYEVDDAARTVKVRTLGHRSAVYRGFTLALLLMRL